MNISSFNHVKAFTSNFEGPSSLQNLLQNRVAKLALVALGSIAAIYALCYCAQRFFSVHLAQGFDGVGLENLAEYFYQNALEYNPNDEAALVAYGEHLNNNFEKEKAAQQLQKALNLNPENALAAKHYAQTLWEEGKLDEAVQQAKIAVEKRPDDVEALLCYGKILKRQEKHQDAEEQFKKALNLQPLQSDILYEYGRLLLDQRRFQEMVDMMQDAVNKKKLPLVGVCLFKEGCLKRLCQLGYFEEVAAEYKKDQDHHDVRVKAYAEVLFAQGKYADAAYHYAKLTDTDFALDERHRCFYGVSLFKQDKYEEALIQLKKVMIYDKKPLLALAYIGEIYRLRGEVVPAAGWYQQCLERIPLSDIKIRYAAMVGKICEKNIDQITDEYNKISLIEEPELKVAAGKAISEKKQDVQDLLEDCLNDPVIQEEAAACLKIFNEKGTFEIQTELWPTYHALPPEIINEQFSWGK